MNAAFTGKPHTPNPHVASLKPVGEGVAPPMILVVDDDPGAQGFLSTFLEARGYTVRTASRVEDAIRQLRLSGIDAVVLDVKMPRRSGLDVLTYIRQEPTLRSLPVLILTGAQLTPEEEAVVASRRAYVFYKQEGDLEEFVSYIERLTSAS